VLTDPESAFTSSGGVDPWFGTLVGIASGLVPQITGGEGVLPPYLRSQPPAQIETGITGRAALRCSTKRRRWKVVQVPTSPGSSTFEQVAVAYCPPRRMNPLNPRALGRAARRIGRFHQIAQGIEKLVQRACKSGIGRRSSRPRLPGCSPRRKC
jgi:hypothetical protein